MRRIYYNGTVRYNRNTKKYQIACEICWEGPKGRWGQGFASEATTEGRAKAALAIHIRRSHGVEPKIRVGLPIS